MTPCIRRREFITLLGGAAAWPFAVRAQQTMPVIGVLYGVSAGAWVDRMAGFRRGLGETGFGAARLAAIPAGESPANRGVQSLL
jgi:putative ABC transport system substrate-binding protein